MTSLKGQKEKFQKQSYEQRKRSETFEAARGSEKEKKCSCTLSSSRCSPLIRCIGTPNQTSATSPTISTIGVSSKALLIFMGCLLDAAAVFNILL